MSYYGKKKKVHPASIRKSEATPLKEVIQQMVDAYNLNKKFDQTQVVNLWPKLMGNTIASRTKTVFVKGSKLFVEVESSVVKHELNMHKAKIIELFATEMGRIVIKEVIIL
ncbi:MAG: putative nucleic acid-binding Zn ribbon protein [Marivirga sp.]|jgi:predicted nucleic acid-binding Zn ribbon protein